MLAMTQWSNPVALPQRVIERVRRVLEFHQLTRYTPESLRARGPAIDFDDQPSPYLVFPERRPVELPRDPVMPQADALDVMRYGPDTLPEGLKHPPADTKTLASWLALSAGFTGRSGAGPNAVHLRSCPSAGALYPFEIYIAAFAVDGLEPGLYHFSPATFALCPLRDGPQTLERMLRGRPDLHLLKTCPAALLISTVFWRTCWKYGRRGYRYCLLDAGHLVENVIAAGAGLGIPTLTRLRVSDSAMRELIGMPADADFGTVEAVQAMIIWADRCQHAFKPGAGGVLPPLKRVPLSSKVVDYPEVRAAHQDCVAPGVAVTELRPPLTEMTIIESQLPKVPVAAADPESGLPLGQVLLKRRSADRFSGDPVPHRQFMELNWLSFRTGTFWPMRPAGPHVACIRPMWLVHNVENLQSGIWYYDPVADGWSLLREGDFREAGRKLCLGQDICAQAAALCFMFANHAALMNGAGPDAYRLAHLEAGLIGQRMYIAATAMKLGCRAIGAFYDEEIRRFFGLAQTGWDIVYVMTVGRV